MFELLVKSLETTATNARKWLKDRIVIKVMIRAKVVTITGVIGDITVAELAELEQKVKQMALPIVSGESLFTFNNAGEVEEIKPYAE